MVKRVATFCYQITARWATHNNSANAAAITFYTIFAIAPTFVFATAAAAWLLGRERAGDASRRLLDEVLGEQQAAGLLELLANTSFASHGLLASVISTLVVVYGASRMYVQLRSALNVIMGSVVEGFRAIIRHTVVGRLLAFLFAMIIGALLITVIAMVSIVGYAVRQWEPPAGAPELPLETILRLFSLMVVVTVFFATLKFLPARRPRYSDALVGAAVSGALFELGKYLLETYVSQSLIATAYGPAGALVALLIWIHYSVQILLLGAEVCRYRMDGRETASADND